MLQSAYYIIPGIQVAAHLSQKAKVAIIDPPGFPSFVRYLILHRNAFVQTNKENK